MSDELWTAMAAPEAIEISIASGTVDLTTVTNVVVTWTPPGAAAITWTGLAVISQATGLLVVSHTFAADGSDVPVIGQYRGLVALTTPAGTRRARPFGLTARAYA